MDFSDFCGQSSIVIVVGKGGVGKTTVASALARAAAVVGLDVLLVALDQSGGIPALFGRKEAFGYDEIVLLESPGRVRARALTPDAALTEYLADHGLGRVSRRLVQSGTLDVISTAIPGVSEMLVLARLKQIEKGKTAQLIVLDAPATGHAVTFLTSSKGLADAARGGPLRAQAEQVVEMLADPKRCQVMLVTSPEETPVNEVVETAYRLEDEVGMSLGPVVVNGCYPALEGLDQDPTSAARVAGATIPDAKDAARLGAAAAFRLRRQQVQAHQIDRLASALPLPQIVLPYLFTASVGPAEIGQLAGALTSGVEKLP